MDPNRALKNNFQTEEAKSIYQQDNQITQQFRQSIQQRLSQQTTPEVRARKDEPIIQSTSDQKIEFQVLSGDKNFENESPEIFTAEQDVNSSPNARIPHSSGRTKIVDLSHIQPYNSSNQQYKYQENDQPYQDLQEQFDQQHDEEGEEMYLSEEGTLHINELDPAQQQQIFEAIIQENQALKQELQQAQSQLSKVESQLDKTKQWLRELGGTIKDDIVNLKQTADEAQDMDNLLTENEILRAKCSELETKVNTLSRGDDDQRIRERRNFEKRINELYQVKTDLDESRILLDSKDRKLKEFESNYQQLQEEHFKAIRENQQFQSLLIQKQSSEKIFQTEDMEKQSFKEKEKQTQPYIALRNRTASGDKQNKRLNSDYEGDLSRELTGNMYYKNTNGAIATLNEIQNPFHLDESNIQHHQYTGRKQDKDEPSKLSMGQLNPKTPVKQVPINITISSPTRGNKALVERCEKLEQYCRELIKTNKILDCENRLAIAQLIHLTDATQLGNLSQALNLVVESGKIYEKKSLLQQKSAINIARKPLATLNMNQVQNRKQSVQPKTQKQSLKNLFTLRQGSINPATSKIAKTLANQSFTLINNKDDSKAKINIQQHFNLSKQKNQSLILIPKRQILSNSDLPLQSDNKQFSYAVSIKPQKNIFKEEALINDASSKKQQTQSSLGIKSYKNDQNIKCLNQEASELDIAIEELQMQLKTSKIDLIIRKVTDFYYSLGDQDQIVNLRLDQQSNSIMSNFILHLIFFILVKVQSNDSKGPHYTDFIDFLAKNGYLKNQS